MFASVLAVPMGMVVIMWAELFAGHGSHGN